MRVRGSGSWWAEGGLAGVAPDEKGPRQAQWVERVPLP